MTMVTHRSWFEVKKLVLLCGGMYKYACVFVNVKMNIL
jgi:hypothetical protein